MKILKTLCTPICCGLAIISCEKDGKPISVDIGFLTGNRIKDQQLAQKIFVERGGDEMEGGYTWHHIENSTCLLRVPYTIHALVDHSGGISMAAVK